MNLSYEQMTQDEDRVVVSSTALSDLNNHQNTQIQDVKDKLFKRKLA